MANLVSPAKIHALLHFYPMPFDSLPRDKGQSNLLHELKTRLSNIDPMSGKDISGVLSHPSLADGSLTFYFQTEQTRKDYINMPLNHPSLHLHFKVSNDDDRGGK